MNRRAHELPVLPGRLQRLADELEDEHVPALHGAPDMVGALVELAYALRPQLHEGRVPTYGVLLPPDSFELVNGGIVGEQVELTAVGELDLQFARRFADGVTSFAIRTGESISHVACFGRNMAEEYDLVGLQAQVGGVIVQRHGSGQVRVFGPAGVVRWNGIDWRHDPPVDAWIGRLRTVAGDRLAVEGVRPLLRFAIHELGGRRIGATLIWRPTDRPAPERRFESLVHHAPRLRLAHVGEEAAIAQALSQTDGAAMFDVDATLTALGVRLAPSTEAEQSIGAMEGMRHTSAIRYSHDDPDAVVIVVSDDGPVTLMYAGRAITAADPADERIG
ncbi:MAG: hypothetical protein HKN41_10655 [Ilumatobacter sp.]|nr:hypothetical protein [Ilumatobacter sp.]